MNQKPMLESTIGKLVTTRRGFLIRASAITAAGGTVVVPIVTVGDVRARVEHHVRELRKALGDLYPVPTFTLRCRLPKWEVAQRDPEVWPLIVLVADERREQDAAARASEVVS